jgi:coenzyme F420-reducing hydrogenase delta subunit
LEIEGWERLCQAKDNLLEEKNAENKQMMEQIKQKLEELNIDPNLLQVTTIMS